MSLATLICATLPLACPAYAGEVSHVEIQGDQVLVHFRDYVESASSFVLSGPDRIAIDVQGATAHAENHPRGGTIRSVRLAQFNPTTARVVLDLDRPAYIVDGEFINNGHCLKLKLSELAPGNSAMANMSRMEFQPPAEFRAKPKQDYYSVKIRLPKSGQKLKLPEIKGSRDPKRPLVVIDAGHGGHDPGALSAHGSTREKDLTLAIARAIRDQLIKKGNVRVALTRDDDTFLALKERYGIARRMGADLFISIHADSAASEQAHGATIYTLSEVASDREASRLAARENKADVLNGINLSGSSDDVSSILIDLTQRETMNLSSDFARLLRREGDSRMTFRTNSHRFASFVVLKAPDVPSILLETGYLSNENDYKLLNSRQGRERIAISVSEAVSSFFARKLAYR